MTQRDRLWNERRDVLRKKVRMTVDELIRLVPKLREAGVGRVMDDLKREEND